MWMKCKDSWVNILFDKDFSGSTHGCDHQLDILYLVYIIICGASRMDFGAHKTQEMEIVDLHILQSMAVVVKIYENLNVS